MDNKFATTEAQMLIRAEVASVFRAFIDPSETKEFWFTKGSDVLKVNTEVIWTWEMYDFSAKVIATEIILNKKIKFDWFGSEKPTTVTIELKAIKPDATFVSIVHSGFNQSDEELIETLKDSTAGFTIVLAGLKAYLEHGINLNLIADKHPKELTSHYIYLNQK